MQTLDDPKHVLWKDSKLEAGIKSRLSGPNEYGCYVFLVDGIRERLEKLCRKLKIDTDKPKTNKEKKVGRFGTELQRFSYTLGKSRRRTLLAEVEKNNDDLQKLLGNSDMLEPMRKKRSNTVIPRVLDQIRTQAASLHAVVSKALRCDCSTSHSAGWGLYDEPDVKQDLALTPTRDVVKPFTFNVYFPLKSGAWSNSATDTESADQWYAAEAAMEVREPRARARASLSISDTSSGILTSSSQDEQLTKLRPSRSRDAASSAPSVAPSSPQLSPESIEIIDLCAALKKSEERRPSFGFLRDHEDRLHILTEASSRTLDHSEIQHTVKLNSLLHHSASSDDLLTIGDFSRRQRLNVALVMAKALLRLYPGPLLKSTWSKDDIHFFKSRAGVVRTTHPLLIIDVDRAGKLRDHSPAGRCNARTSRWSILSLGILVLELWFDRPLESHPLRAQYLGADGQITEFTDFNTAQKWQEQALGEGGLELHSITWRCVYCAFGAASQDFEDGRLRQAVYDEVVVGLERLLASFG